MPAPQEFDDSTFNLKYSTYRCYEVHI